MGPTQPAIRTCKATSLSPDADGTLLERKVLVSTVSPRDRVRLDIIDDLGEAIVEGVEIRDGVDSVVGDSSISLWSK